MKYRDIPSNRFPPTALAQRYRGRSQLHLFIRPVQVSPVVIGWHQYSVCEWKVSAKEAYGRTAQQEVRGSTFP